MPERHYAYENLADLLSGLTGRESGLEMLQAMIASGRRVPIADTLDFTLVAAEEGLTRWTGCPGHWAMNPIGSVHGGFAATVLDSAMACAVHSTLVPGERYTTLDLSLTYVRALKPDQPITAEGRLIHRGRSVATAEGKLFDHRGKLAAHGTTSCVILPAPGAA